MQGGRAEAETAGRIRRGTMVTSSHTPQHRAEFLTARGLPRTAWNGPQEGEAKLIYILKTTMGTLSSVTSPKLFYFVNLCFPGVSKCKPLIFKEVVIEAPVCVYVCASVCVCVSE